MISRTFVIRSLACASVAAIASSVSAATAVTAFTEDFTTNAANWYNPSGTAPADWFATGSFDGGSHISASYNFLDQTPGLPFPNNAVNLFRAQDEYNSSNNAFVGNWITGGVTSL
ncbi:MAG TPA: hypothetical protein VG711_02395, partial [Phycisphaerales bacterium]|nr:hypothetical protein [Phycisphaerales bacterium]